MNTRRGFLRHTAGMAGAMSTTAMAQDNQRVIDANDRIRIALIGCGGMGRGNLTQFLHLKGLECVALADVDDTNAAKALKLIEQQGAKAPDLVTRDFRRILDRKDVDAIVVATPDHWHALPTVMGCQAGKDVYVQKPLATSIGEAKAMVDAAHKYNRIVQVGTQQRSLTQFQECVDYVKSGKLGTIRQVRCYAYLANQGEVPVVENSDPPASADYEMWLGPAPERPFNKNRFHFNFRFFWDYSGGTMTDWGAHMIDIGLWGMGSPVPVSAVAVGGKYVWPKDAKETPDTQQVLYEFPGFSMMWEHAMGISHGPGTNGPNEHGVMFYGQNGTAFVDRWGWQVFPESSGFPGAHAEYRSAGVPRRDIRNDGGTHEAHFVDCLRHRKRPRADVEDGYATMVACHLGNLALRFGRKMRWDSEQRRIVDDPEASRLVTYEYRKPWKLSV